MNCKFLSGVLAASVMAMSVMIVGASAAEGDIDAPAAQAADANNYTVDLSIVPTPTEADPGQTETITDYNVGDTFKVNINATANSEVKLASYQFQLVYDKDIVQLNEVVAGTTFESAGTVSANTGVAPTDAPSDMFIDTNKMGIVTYTLPPLQEGDEAGDNLPTIGTGDTLLATAEFEVIANETTLDAALGNNDSVTKSIKLAGTEFKEVTYDIGVPATNENDVQVDYTLHNVKVTFAGVPDKATLKSGVKNVFYARYGKPGLYSDYDRKSTVNAITPEDLFDLSPSYRFASGEDSEPLWTKDGTTNTFTTTAVLETESHSTNVTYNVNTVKQCNVTFAVAEGDAVKGSLSSNPTLTIDEGKDLTAESGNIPTPTAEANCEFVNWTWDDPDNGEQSATTTADLLKAKIKDDTTFTAHFSYQKYELTHSIISGITVIPKAGIDDSSDKWYVTYNSDAVFQVSTAGSNVSKVSYKVGNGTAKPLTKDLLANTYTIPGDQITGAVNVVIELETKIKVKFESPVDGGSLSETDTAKLEVEVSLSEVLKSERVPDPKPDVGYKFTGWTNDGKSLDPATIELSATNVKLVEDTNPGTYVVTFVPTFAKEDYTITFEPDVFNVITGVNGSGTAQYNETDITFSGNLVYNVKYKKQTGVAEDTKEPQYDGGHDLVAVDDVFTIQKDQITANIVVYADTIPDYSITSFDKDAYKALADDKSILLVQTNKLSEGSTIAFRDDTTTTFYYSPNYEGYVAIVDDTALDPVTDIAKQLTVVEGNPVEVNYDGDIDGATGITASDAALVNQVLFGLFTSPTDLMRFELDVVKDTQTDPESGTEVLAPIVDTKDAFKIQDWATYGKPQPATPVEPDPVTPPTE